MPAIVLSHMLSLYWYFLSALGQSEAFFQLLVNTIFSKHSFKRSVVEFGHNETLQGATEWQNFHRKDTLRPGLQIFGCNS